MSIILSTLSIALPTLSIFGRFKVSKTKSLLKFVNDNANYITNNVNGINNTFITDSVNYYVTNNKNWIIQKSSQTMIIILPTMSMELLTLSNSLRTVSIILLTMSMKLMLSKWIADSVNYVINNVNWIITAFKSVTDRLTILMTTIKFICITEKVDYIIDGFN